MTEEGKYIYAIIKEDQDKNFGSIGINNRLVNLVRWKDIAAVTSNTPVVKFDRMDKTEFTRHLATHQKVNEVLMKDYDVVPMAFGIIAENPEEVPRVLERAYIQFKTALKKIEDKAEFTVQVWWDKQAILEEIVRTDPEIQKLKEETASKKGPFGLPTKLKLGKRVHEAVEQKRELLIKDIQTLLDNVSFDSTLNKLLDDNMIANFSFLIEKTKEPDFDVKMNELGKKYENKLKFKYIGPMPPYSFVTINLDMGNFGVIDEARKVLGLGEEATLDEVKKAYYKLAHRYHPDKYQKSPGGPEGAEEQMKKIIEAYGILENYCESSDSFIGKRKKYSFREEDVKNSIMIH